jgi:hypothetical protein
MRTYINLLTLEVSRGKPLDPHMTLDIDVEEAEDGRDEWDRSVTLLVMVPRGTYLSLGLAPNEPQTVN